MFDDAAFAKLLDRSVAPQGDGAVLDVELLQAPTVVGNVLYTLISDHFTAFDTQFFEAETQLC